MRTLTVLLLLAAGSLSADPCQSAIAQRDRTRNAIFRVDGPLQAMLLSGRDLKANASKPYPKDFASSAKMLYGPNEVLQSASAKAAMHAAVQRANKYLADGGDIDGLKRAYLEGVTASAELYGVPAKLTPSVVPFAREHAERMKDVMTELSAWINQHEAANERCKTSLSSAKAQAAWERLEGLQQQVDDIPLHYEAAAQWLLPFLYDESAAADSRLTAMLLEQASPRFEMIRNALAASAAQQESLKRELETALSKGTK
ncbi:MAG TPA: hypothetical protein VKB93_15895 [Thermoanaerobaculia bacterium]|nr:hypothetical protein [Thermoanaerobaculia bacterium]